MTSQPHAAVDRDRGAGDPPSGVRRKELNSPSDIGWFGDAPERDPLQERLLDSWIGQLLRHERGADDSRSESIDPDSVLAELECRRPCQCFEGRFRGAVVREAVNG